MLIEENIYLQYNPFKEKYNIDINYLLYLQIILVIPRDWKQIIEKDDKCIRTEFCCSIFGKMSILQYSNKSIYNMYINKVQNIPQSQDKWIENYPFLEVGN